MKVPGITYKQGRNSYKDSDGRKYGIAIHNTSNDASAADEASYATRRTDGISSHFYVDKHQVIQSLDTSARAGHAGSSEGNQNAVAVEIVGTNGKSRDWWLKNVCWDELGKVLAAVCKTYGIAVRRASVAEMKKNPKVKAFYSHNDMRQAWGGTTHDDPGPNFPWDKLFASVNAALHPPKPTPKPAPKPAPPPAPEDDREDDDMLLIKMTTDSTMYLCHNGYMRPLKDPRLQLDPLLKGNNPVKMIEVNTRDELDIIGGPERTLTDVLGERAAKAKSAS